MQTIPASTRVLSNQPRSIRMFGSGSQVASGPAGVALRRAAVIVDSRSRRGIRGRVVTRAAQRPEPPRAFSTDLSDNQNLESLMERHGLDVVERGGNKALAEIVKLVEARDAAMRAVMHTGHQALDQVTPLHRDVQMAPLTADLTRPLTHRRLRERLEPRG